MGPMGSAMQTQDHTINGRPLSDVMADLGQPIPIEQLKTRQQGKPNTYNGKLKALFIAYIDAHVVRERLDAVIPGRWELEVTPIGEVTANADGGSAKVYAVKAALMLHMDQGYRLRREDIGQGKDPKAASSDAFKRAAVRFGIGHELASMPKLMVEVDGDGKYAKPKEDVQALLRTRISRGGSGVKSAERSESSKVRQPEGDRATARENPAPAPTRRVTDAAKVITRMTPEARAKAAELRALVAHPLFTDQEREAVEGWLTRKVRTAEEIQEGIETDQRNLNRRQRGAAREGAVAPAVGL